MFFLKINISLQTLGYDRIIQVLRESCAENNSKKQIWSIPQIGGWRKTNTEVQLLVAGWPHWQEATSGGGCPWSKSSSSPPFGAQLYSAIAPECGFTTVWCSNLYSFALQPVEYCCHLVLLFQYVEIQHRPAQWLMVLPKHHLVFFYYKSIKRIK